MSIFPQVKKGDTPTFLDADFANRVLEFLNGIATARVTPAGAGKFVVTDKGFVLDLAQGKATSQQGTGAPGSGGSSSVEAQLAALTGQVNAIKASLQNATITATCNTSDGTIVITLTLPNFPP